MTPFTLTLIVLLTPMLAVAVVNVALAPRLHRFAAARQGPRVSLLVPARDEAENLRRLLPALRATGYPALEVLVLDDQSTDGTAELVRGHAAADPRIRLLEGKEPPAGWTGKNWACHQLALEADGQILLFCDADVVPGADAVGRTVTAFDRTRSDAVTGFPRHERGGWFEEAVIPVVAKLPIGALLPLPLVRHTRATSLAVGNGQWIAWRRAAYDRVGGHAGVRADVLEDVRMARRAKRQGLRLLPVLATRDLAIRMYADREGAWSGFEKNLYLLAGGRDWSLALTLILFLTAMLGPFLAPLQPSATTAAWLPVAELATVRILSAGLFGEGPRSLLLHPVAVVAVVALALSSRARHRRGTVAWKQRVVRKEVG